MARNINRIIVHCSATNEGEDFSIADIDRWHKIDGYKRKYAPKDAKYKHVGYHYVVNLDGTIDEGRTLEEAGAHTEGYNSHSIGICYVGGHAKDGKPKDTRTKAQKEALIDLLRRLVCKYPTATIHGHREFSNKACPCFDAKEEYRNI